MIAALFVDERGVYAGLPALRWGSSGIRMRLYDGFRSAEERRRAVRTGAGKRLSKRERAATPVPFRDLLLSMAATARRDAA